jgi:predicted nucleic acid-binding protein
VIYLVDTNILLRFADRTHPLHQNIRSAIRDRRQMGDQPCATAQNYIEFWNVVTRPAARNGFGLTPIAADRFLQLIERIFPLLPDSPAIYPEWRRLVKQYGVSGVQVHDARLVAAMLANQVTTIMTLNVGDFRRYAPEGIGIIDPSEKRLTEG